MKAIILSAVLFLCHTCLIHADEPFQGVIVNHKNEPLKGITIRKSGSDENVRTDRFGEFRIANTLPTDTICFEYKGERHSIALNGIDNMKIIVQKGNKKIGVFTRNGETFHGTLMRQKGKAIRGAIVYVNDPFEYVKSDRNGEFYIDDVQPTDTLHVKCDGYIHDIAIDGSKGMYIIIGRNNGRRIDDDMVNMGAGAVGARYYNGPRNVRTAAQLEATGHSDLIMAMIGIPGVSLCWTDRRGRSLDHPNISLRHSIHSPLWIVDGVQMTAFPGLTVMEVAKVEVLTDGAMYGTRGAGGVIIVTTKGSSF